jgi:hypothetical protein
MVQDQAAGVHACRAVPDLVVITKIVNRLRRNGFRYETRTNQGTKRTVLVFTRVWRGQRDVVVDMSDGEEAVAYRVWDADFDAADPTMVEPDIALWRQSGPFVTVAAALLDLGIPQEHSHSPSTTPKDHVGGPGW